MLISVLCSPHSQWVLKCSASVKLLKSLTPFLFSLDSFLLFILTLSAALAFCLLQWHYCRNISINLLLLYIKSLKQCLLPNTGPFSSSGTSTPLTVDHACRNAFLPRDAAGQCVHMLVKMTTLGRITTGASCFCWQGVELEMEMRLAVTDPLLLTFYPFPFSFSLLSFPVNNLEP